MSNNGSQIAYSYLHPRDLHPRVAKQKEAFLENVKVEFPLAVLSLVAILFSAPARSFADTYQLSPLTSDNGYFFYGIDDTGHVVINNPFTDYCGFSARAASTPSSTESAPASPPPRPPLPGTTPPSCAILRLVWSATTVGLRQSLLNQTA
jgi:hypothetical protein